jgi:hypothetical protein
MNIFIGEHEIHLINETQYSVNSVDNVRQYRTESCRTDKYQHSCAHGIMVGDIDQPLFKAIFMGVGGVTDVHKNSIASCDETGFLAVGDTVFSISLPTLKVNWFQKVDFATCFGIYWLEKHQCLITWGEVDICRFAADGTKTWSFSGADIFTESFELTEENIILRDFENKEYVISIERGCSV